MRTFNTAERLSCVITLVMLCGSGVQAEVQKASGDHAPELFKQFLEKRPIIQNVIFKRTFLGDVSPWPGFTTNSAFYHGRWQPDAFYVKMVSNLTNIETGYDEGFFVGKNLRRGPWSISGGNLTYLAGDNKESINSYDPTFAFAKAGEDLLDFVLNMGIGFQRGSLTWSGDEFSARSSRGTVIKGQLFISQHGLPEKIICSVEGSANGSVSEFTYATNVGLFFIPSRVRSSRLVAGQVLPWEEDEFVQLGTSDSSLADEVFGPERFVVSGYTKTFVKSNNVTYWINPKQRKMQAVRTTHQPITVGGSKYKRLVIGVFFLLISAGAVLWLWKLKQHKNQQTHI